MNEESKHVHAVRDNYSGEGETYEAALGDAIENRRLAGSFAPLTVASHVVEFRSSNRYPGDPARTTWHRVTVADVKERGDAA